MIRSLMMLETKDFGERNLAFMKPQIAGVAADFRSEERGETAGVRERLVGFGLQIEAKAAYDAQLTR